MVWDSCNQTKRKLPYSRHLASPQIMVLARRPMFFWRSCSYLYGLLHGAGLVWLKKTETKALKKHFPILVSSSHMAPWKDMRDFVDEYCNVIACKWEHMRKSYTIHNSAATSTSTPPNADELRSLPKHQPKAPAFAVLCMRYASDMMFVWK